MAGTKRRSGSATNRSGDGKSGGKSRTTTDVREIRRVVEEKGGRPACVKGTEGRGGSCLLRIDFPGGAGREKLEPMNWEEFGEVFEQNDLAMVYDEKPNVRFTKFVSRDGAAGGSRNARGGGSKGKAGSSARGSSARGGSRGDGRSKSGGSSARVSRSQPGEKQRGRASSGKSSRARSTRGAAAGRSR